VAYAAHLHAPASQYTVNATCFQLAPPEPRLEVTIGETTASTRPTVSALLDTGATTGLISRSYVDKLLAKHTIERQRLTSIDPVVITYGNGSQAQTSTEICLPITLSPQGTLRQVHLLVVPGMKPALVFGRSVLKQLQVTLRYSSVPATAAPVPASAATLSLPDLPDAPGQDASPLHDHISSVTHLRADVTLPSWVRLDPALQIQEVLDSTDWLVVACVSDGSSQYIWCDIDDIQVSDIPVPREHPKLTSAPDAVKAEAVRLVDWSPCSRLSPLTDLKTSLRGCVHAISMDVQDTFMQLRAGVGLQRFLGLYHRGGTLVFTRVPYGLAISPHILEVAVRHVVGRLITAGVLPDCQ
ncbi:hypothetical protein FOZ62_010317, partial [Perkinsus olseni]